MVESKVEHTYTTKKYDKRYASKFLKRSNESQKVFEPEWMEKVEYKTPVYTTVYGGWGGNYQSAYWKNRGVQNAFTNFNKQKALPIKTPSTKDTKPKETPAVGEMNPCMECVFKAHKIDWVMEQIAAGVEIQDGPSVNNFIPDDNFGTEDMVIDTYHCEQCNSVFQSEDWDCVCPICKTDEHLVDVTGDVDLDNDILNADFSAADEAGLESIKNTCLECGHTFEYILGDTNCPHCGVPIPKFGEDLIGDQMKSDSGEFLDPEYEKIMKAAEAADNEKRLPIPGQDETPLPEKSGVFSFMRLTRKRKKKRKKK
jgi:Zn finger protein HypA/HybF involved in hydrogenase expression